MGGSGLGGVTVEGVAKAVVLVAESKCAGLRRSKETVFGLPWISRVKCLGVRLSTLYGPSYGCWGGFQIASLRTKTCVHVVRPAGMCEV